LIFEPHRKAQTKCAEIIIEIERFELKHQAGLALPPAAAEPAEVELSLRDYLRQLRRNWRILLGSVVVITGLSVLVLFQLTPKYKSSAILVMEPPKQKVGGIESVYTRGDLTLEALHSEKEIIRSRAVAAKVIEKLKLDRDKEFNAALNTDKGLFGWASGLFTFWQEKKVLTPEAQKELEQVRVIDALRRVLTVDAVPRSNLLEIAVSSPEPEKATKIANTVAEVYPVAQAATNSRAAARATKWLRDRIAKLRTATEDADRAVETYRARHGLVRGNDDKELTSSQIAQLSTQLIQARTKRASEEARLAQVEKMLRQGGGIASAGDVLSSRLIQRLSERESQLIGRRAELSATYGPKHPKLLAINAEMADLRRKIRLEMRKIVIAVRGDVAVARAHEAALREKLRELESKVGASNQMTVRLRALEREAQANRTLLENVLKRYKEAQAQQAIQSANVRIVSYASVPIAPYFPRKKLLAGLALFASLVVGVGLIALKESLDSVFRNGQQVESMTGLPVLDLIPEVKVKNFSRAEFAKFIKENPLSQFAEALRGLHLGLLTSNVDNPPKSVLVTSSVPEEGKSLVACALAEIVMASGAKVLLIDCDLRRPSLQDYFGFSRSPGLVEFMSGAAQLNEIIHRVEDKGLDVITAGRNVANPSAVLASERTRDLIKQLREVYDMVIIDTAPALPINDARILGSVADSVVFAVRWGKTRRETAAATAKKLQASGVHVAGAVLNRVDQKKHGFYDYSAYDTSSRKYAKYYTR
jgi:exopolysaccharide transport family protein